MDIGELKGKKGFGKGGFGHVKGKKAKEEAKAREARERIHM